MQPERAVSASTPVPVRLEEAQTGESPGEAARGEPQMEPRMEPAEWRSDEMMKVWALAERSTVWVVWCLLPDVNMLGVIFLISVILTDA